MNLVELREFFRKTSGRFDLVNADFSDNGANFFINDGRMYLDRLDETQKSWASCYRFVEVGHSTAVFPYCRAIKEVWVASVGEGRWQLKKKDLQDLIEGYLTGFPSSRETGMPLYYSPCLTRYIPENTAIEDLEAFIGFVENPVGSAHDYNAILLNVPTDAKLMVDIRGLFYSMELVNDTDANYWSTVHPMLLYMAAMRSIEITNRNSQGVKDWEASIATTMTQLGMDLVEELIAEVDEMGD